MQLLFQSVLSLVPVEQSAQDGGETVLSQGAHGAYQLLGGRDTVRLAINIPKPEIAIGVSFVCLCRSFNKKKKSTTGTRGLINSALMHRAAFPQFLGGCKRGKGRNRAGWAGHTGREESLVGRAGGGGRGNTGSPSFSMRLEKNPGSVRWLNGLTQQHKHTPVVVKGPSLQSHRPAGHT